MVGRPGLSPRSIKTFEGDKNFKIVSIPDTTCHWLAMNQTKAPLDNVKVRQAISYAIPIAAIVPNVLQGYGSAMTSPLMVVPGPIMVFASTSPRAAGRGAGWSITGRS